VKLPASYYQTNDVVSLARDLLGKSLFTNIQGKLTGGIIAETEAYAGIHDRASHAYGGRKTKRTETMYHKGGISYIYLCYGIHYLFNVVTGDLNIPHAILIRSIFPSQGIETMLKRTGKKKFNSYISNGPGKLTKALGISILHNGIPLNGDTIWIEDNGIQIPNSDIQITKRIGIEYAGPDASLPYRFLLNDEK
jgi:DNA-3-methyladenine glycosylase